MGKADIEYLKLKMKLYVKEEQYEKAAKIKKWIIELGGDPDIKPKTIHQKKNYQ